jgi:hypothetical protein
MFPKLTILFKTTTSKNPTKKLLRITFSVVYLVDISDIFLFFFFHLILTIAVFSTFVLYTYRYALFEDWLYFLSILFVFPPLSFFSCSGLHGEVYIVNDDLTVMFFSHHKFLLFVYPPLPLSDI